MRDFYFQDFLVDFISAIKFTSIYIDGVYFNHFYIYGIAHFVAQSMKNAFNSVLLVDFKSGEVLHEF